MAAGRRLLACPDPPARSFIWANTSIDTCIGYFAKSWSPHQARPDQNRIRRRKNSDPLRQIGCRFQKLLLFPDKCATVRQLQLAGGAGSRGEKKLASRVLLALRQFPRLAGRVH